MENVHLEQMMILRCILGRNPLGYAARDGGSYREIRCEDGRWMQLAQDRVQCRCCGLNSVLRGCKRQDTGLEAFRWFAVLPVRGVPVLKFCPGTGYTE